MGLLTVNEIKAKIKLGSGRYSDGGGLYLVAPKSGTPFWMLRFTSHGKRREMTLGKYNDLSLAEARLQSELNKKMLRDGTDPLSARFRELQSQIKTVNELFDDWFIGVTKRLKYPNIPKRIFNKEISPIIGQVQLKDVNPLDIRTIINRVNNSGRPTIANDTLMQCKQLFNHAVKLGLINHNPASAFTSVDAGGVEKSKDRALTITEIKDVFKIFRQNSSRFSRENYLALALLLVLGVRKTELIHATWDEFNFTTQTWLLPAHRSKTEVEITIPIPEQAIAWLHELQIRACGSIYLFPSRRTSKNPFMSADTLNRAVSKLFGREPGKKKQPPNVMGDIEHFTVHDLRRTCRSLLAQLGIESVVAEKCLNHKLKGVEGIYNRHDYLSERKTALSKLADFIAPHINQN